MSKVLSLIVASLLFHRNVVLAKRVIKVKICPYNQVYLPAVQLGCPPTCDTPRPFCKVAERPGCGCPKGQILAGSARKNPNKCIPYEKCKKCPRNQVYLKDVQYGCPPTCDQPQPRCRAARGPGCGCPEGTILAGSSRKKRPDRCIPYDRCKCPRNQVFLPDVPFSCPATCEQPVPLCDGPSGPGCGCPKGMVLGGNPRSERRKCVHPEGCKCRATGCKSEICSIEPVSTTCQALTCEEQCLEKFGKCETQQVQCVTAPCLPDCDWNTDSKGYKKCIKKCNNQCKVGLPVKDPTSGKELFCGRGPNSAKCPVGTKCVIDPLDRFAVCCNDVGDDDRCKVGLPVKDPISGKELFCGRGPNRVECPYGTTCVIHPTDRYAVCCNNP